MKRSPWLQAGWLLGIWWLAQTAAQAFDLPIPGGVIGMLLLLGLLASGLIGTRWVKRGSSGLLDHMVLFFVPAMMAVMNHPELMSLLGLKILVVIVAGTLMVMAGTALVVDLCMRWSASPDEQ